MSSSIRALVRRAVPARLRPVLRRNIPVRGEQAATSRDLEYCYRLLLGRVPDQGGWAHYSRLLDRGVSYEELVLMFLASAEFRGRHAWLWPEGTATTAVETEGLRFHVPAEDRTAGRALLTGGVYEPHVTAVLKRRLHEGMTFVDVGASFGYFSMLARSIVGGDGRVIAIEPGSSNCSLLLFNSVVNGFDDIELWNLAVDRAPGVVIYRAIGTNGQIEDFSGGQDSFADVLGDGQLVRTAPLDEILAHAPRVDVMKLDIEGAEHRALQGARSIIDRHGPILIFEYLPEALSHISCVSGEELLRFIEACGYGLSAIMPDGSEAACDAKGADELLQSTRAAHLDIVAQPKRTE